MGGSKEHVLVVDDDDSRHTLARYLELEGEYTSHKAVSADDALQVFSSLQQQGITPVAVLTDYDMGSKNGIELTQELRRRGFRGIIMMLTATEGIKNQAMAAGVDEFISKPMSPIKTFEILKQAVQQRNSTVELPGTSQSM